jgi:hypothetical protein
VTTNIYLIDILCCHEAMKIITMPFYHKLKEHNKKKIKKHKTNIQEGREM